MSEELFYEREEAHHTNHEEILMAKRNCQQDMDVLLAYGQDLDRLAGEGDEERLKAVLEEIVPEHEPTGRA